MTRHIPPSLNFARETSFRNSNIKGPAHFSETTFESAADFSDAKFRIASFGNTYFRSPLRAGAISIGFLAFGRSAGSTETAADPQIVVALVGPDVNYAGTVPPPDPTDENSPNLYATYFDVNWVNLRTNQLIRTATDCFSEVNTGANGISLIGTTTFYLPQGTLVARGRTTVQPILDENGDLLADFDHGDADDPFDDSPGATINSFTHTTGSPEPDDGTSNILSGTKAFKNSSGTVHLYGLVNISEFDLVVGGTIGFDCLFIIDLD